MALADWSLSQPYRAQGAAIAVEDAAVLGAILSHVSSLAQVPALLQAYQDLRCVPSFAFFSPPHLSISISQTRLPNGPPHFRLPRASATQDSSRLNQKIFHLPDGPAQRARDDAMRTAMAAELEGKPIPDGNPNQWADRTKSQVQFDYDAYAEVDRWWLRGGGREHIQALAPSCAGAADCGSNGGRAGMMMKARL